MRYKVKSKYNKVVRELIDLTTGSKSEIIFTDESYVYGKLKELEVLDEFCDVVKPEWEEPVVAISCKTISDDISLKARLLIRMQSWADFYNKEDNFVPYWLDNDQRKWGLGIEEGRVKVDYCNTVNTFIFQISLSSEHRTFEMLGYFKDQIQELIGKKLL